MPLILQWSIVGVALAFSTLYVLQRQWPALAARMRTRMVLWLIAPTRSEFARRLGRALAPPPRIAFAPASGCKACADGGSCAKGANAGP